MSRESPTKLLIKCIDPVSWVSTIESMTSSKESPRSKRQLRGVFGKHAKKKFTVKADGVHERVFNEQRNKFVTKPGDEQYSTEKKRFHSKHTSTSLVDVTEGRYSEPFSHNGRHLGVILPAVDECALVNRAMVYSGMTYERYYDFDTREKAQAYHDRVVGEKLFANLDESHSMHSPAQVKTEVMARLKWDESFKECAIGVFAGHDNAHVRVEALLRAADLKNQLRKRSEENGVAFDESYTVPVRFYNYEAREIQDYTAPQQENDLKKIAHSPNAALDGVTRSGRRELNDVMLPVLKWMRTGEFPSSNLEAINRYINDNMTKATQLKFRLAQYIYDRNSTPIKASGNSEFKRVVAELDNYAEDRIRFGSGSGRVFGTGVNGEGSKWLPISAKRNDPRDIAVRELKESLDRLGQKYSRLLSVLEFTKGGCCYGEDTDLSKAIEDVEQKLSRVASKKSSNKLLASLRAGRVRMHFDEIKPSMARLLAQSKELLGSIDAKLQASMIREAKGNCVDQCHASDEAKSTGARGGHVRSSAAKWMQEDIRRAERKSSGASQAPDSNRVEAVEARQERLNGATAEAPSLKL